jgi:catechol 2,3-dioxygenase-like lactoylglutathione lyase family enzyme
MKLEVVVIPVSDVDRAKYYYGSLGWRLDATSLGATRSVLYSSRLRDPRARSTSAGE